MLIIYNPIKDIPEWRKILGVDSLYGEQTYTVTVESNNSNTQDTLNSSTDFDLSLIHILPLEQTNIPNQVPPGQISIDYMEVGSLQNARIIGVYANTYILLETEGELVIIDQHAACLLYTSSSFKDHINITINI